MQHPIDRGYVFEQRRYMKNEMTMNDKTMIIHDMDEDSNYPSKAYSWYVVVLLMCFYVLSFMDRQIIAVLIEPIKEDLLLSDVEMSLLGGLSFVLFYSIAGIFMGRLADSVSRPKLIAVGVFIWSLTTAFCGVASKFWHLLFLRMGVGLGESALLPSTLSLLSSYFPAKKLATPTSVFMLGAPIGIGLAFVGGGYLYGLALDITATNDWQDFPLIGGMIAWQLVLVFLGVFGMSMTLLLMTVREPRDSQKLKTTETKVKNKSQAASFSEVKLYCLSNWKAIGGLYFGMSFISLASYSQAFWDVTFLTRTYGWDATTGSIWYGAVQLISGFCGMVGGGIVADKLTSRGVQAANLKMVIFGIGIAIPFSLIYPLASTANASLWLMTPAIFGNSMAFALTASSLQRLFPATMIGLAAGIYFFISNAVGIGFGPTAVAVMTEYVLDDLDQIKYSLVTIGGIARIIAFIMVFMCLKHYIKLVSSVSTTKSS